MKKFLAGAMVAGFLVLGARGAATARVGHGRRVVRPLLTTEQQTTLDNYKNAAGHSKAAKAVQPRRKPAKHART